MSSPQGVSGEELSKALKDHTEGRDEGQSDPEASSDNPQDADPAEEDGQSDVPEKYQDKSFDEVAEMHKNAEKKISEQSEQLQELRSKMDRLEGKMEGMNQGQEQESESEEETLDRDELKQQAVQNVKDSVGEQDFLDADPGEFAERIFDEVDRLVEQREQQLQSQINEQRTQQLDQRAKKAQDALLDRYPDAESYLNTMGDVVTENPMIAQRVQQAPDVDTAVDHLEEALLIAKKREGDAPLLEPQDASDESSNSDNQTNDTGNSSVTNGTGSSDTRQPSDSDQKDRLEKIVSEQIQSTSKKFG